MKRPFFQWEFPSLTAMAVSFFPLASLAGWGCSYFFCPLALVLRGESRRVLGTCPGGGGHSGAAVSRAFVAAV